MLGGGAPARYRQRQAPLHSPRIRTVPASTLGREWTLMIGVGEAVGIS